MNRYICKPELFTPAFILCQLSRVANLPEYTSLYNAVIFPQGESPPLIPLSRHNFRLDLAQCSYTRLAATQFVDGVATS